jgi:hypothetical protein
VLRLRGGSRGGRPTTVPPNLLALALKHNEKRMICRKYVYNEKRMICPQIVLRFPSTTVLRIYAYRRFVLFLL